MATIDDLQKIDIRIGRIFEVEDYPEAKKASFRLKIDFGKDIGIKTSIAQLVKNYSREALINKLVVCVVNFPPRQIGSGMSEVLTLGIPDENGDCVLVRPERDVPIGGKLY